jgi:hypothetical protein
LVILSRFFAWKDALVIVKPETLIASSADREKDILAI